MLEKRVVHGKPTVTYSHDRAENQTCPTAINPVMSCTNSLDPVRSEATADSHIVPFRRRGPDISLRFDVETDVVGEALLIGQRFSTKYVAVDAMRAHGAAVARASRSVRSEARRVIYRLVCPGSLGWEP